MLLPAIVFVIGLEVLERLPFSRQDPLREMHERTAPVLEKLVQTKYFRIIRLNINEECQLGVMRRICQSKSCTVCRCNDADIPEFWTNT